MLKQTNRFIGAILLITGTCIGAGMLALPVSTGAYGMLVASVIFLICWGFLTYTALLMLEANMWVGSDANLISMAGKTLGKVGQAVAWITYLLLLYSLMAAYLSGMDALVKTFIHHIFHEKIHAWYGCAVLMILFASTIYIGAKPVDYINRLLVIGLFLSFVLLFAFITPHVQVYHLARTQFHDFWLALPIVITAFGYHAIIPSLRNYLHDDAKKLKRAILIGSILPLIVYLIWETLILGTIPLAGQHGLLAILKAGQPAVGLANSLDQLLANAWISVIAKYFAFFAIATSFIGVSFGLFDFLADGFHIKKTKFGRFLTAIITFLPPLIFALAYPHGFILALGYAGIFVAILLGILPALMVWRGRYGGHFSGVYRVFGGRIALSITIIFFLIVIFTELFT